MNEEKINGGVVVKTKTRMSRTQIASIITMCLLGIIAISIILTAIIPQSYAITLPKTEPSYVEIYKGSTSIEKYIYNGAKADKNSDQKKMYDKLMKAFDGSFTTSTLNAIFQKELSNNIEYNYLGTNNKTLSSIVSSNEYVLEFVWASEQTLQKGSKDYICDELATSSSLYENGVVKFKKMWVTVNNIEGATQVKFYIPRRVSETSEDSNYAVIEIVTKGYQSNLASVIAEILA
jgi:hypothetical protein